MGKITGFKEIDRLEAEYESVNKRLRHYKEFTHKVSKKDISLQGARCMDCGIPYCQRVLKISSIEVEFFKEIT